MVDQWRSNTPSDFLFSPKLPKKITHDNKLKDSGSTLFHFYTIVSRLKEKLGPIALGAGLFVPLIAYWFSAAYGIPDTISGPLLGVSSILTAFCVLLAPASPKGWGTSRQ